MAKTKKKSTTQKLIDRYGRQAVVEAFLRFNPERSGLRQSLADIGAQEKQGVGSARALPTPCFSCAPMSASDCRSPDRSGLNRRNASTTACRPYRSMSFCVVDFFFVFATGRLLTWDA